MRRTNGVFDTVHSEGGLLPADLLARIAAGDRDVPGLAPADYHLLRGERINEAANRAWNRLLGAWAVFRDARDKLPVGAPDAALTRDRWLLVLFQELGYGRLEPARALELEGRSFPISHIWHRSPVHLVGFRTDLDTRTRGVAGAARQSPHSLVQEFLNRSPDHAWGFVGNGLRLRLLRDSASLTRQAFLEFDLEAMMEGEAYADFVLLWLVAHESRLEPRGEPPRADGCWLEQWMRLAQERGTRALDQLRDGVETAITAFGRGFLAHPRNEALRHALRGGELDTQDYYRQLLRLVYRLLFLFVAEDRDALLDPNASPQARERYGRFYSTIRLRHLAQRRRGSKHADLYHALRLVMEKLGRDDGCPQLALPALGSFLWQEGALPNLVTAHLANRDLLEAVRALATTSEGRVTRAVDFKNLGSEELGSIYESLLELHPRINADEARFELTTAGGHERKTTGSYYTPTSLIRCLLDTALEPILDQALESARGSTPNSQQPNTLTASPPEAALLALKVVDPACGSGHFLIAAGHRIARRLAMVRTGGEEPAPPAMRTALRDVIGRCLYGVDVNEMAVELCKVSLWMEALEPGKPLSFLEGHIQQGNSLLGATPALLANGIPDDAFKPIEGDDKKIASALRKQNKNERTGQTALFETFAREGASVYGALGAAAEAIDIVADDSIADVHQKEERHRRLVESSEYTRARLEADAWCAAFVQRKAKGAPEPITQDLWLRLSRAPDAAPAPMLAEVARLRRQYGFFHWHLAFPDVFLTESTTDDPTTSNLSSGFDAVLGNPPWEHVEMKEHEWFAGVRPDIEKAPNSAKRKALIAALEDEDAGLFSKFRRAQRDAEARNHLVREGGRFPLCARGRINTYALFAEANRQLVGPRGRVGCIVPSGIATDDTTKYFFQDLIESGSLLSLYSFSEIRAIFIDTDSRNPFCLLTLTGADAPAAAADFVFFADQPEDLQDEFRHFALTADDIALLNPNTRTCPVFRTKRDAELTKSIYRRVPVLIREAHDGQPEVNPWGISFSQGLFNMASDSGLFRTRDQLEAEGWQLAGNIFRRGEAEYLPLYEAKMVHHFNHRFGDYRDQPPGAQGTALPDVPVERLQDPNYTVLPRYWVPAAEVEDRLRGKWDRPWLLGWRDICRSTDERTVIASIVPRVGVGHKMPLAYSSSATTVELLCLYAGLNSFVFDYVARQKIGGTSLTYFYLKQFPFIVPGDLHQLWVHATGLETWIGRRVLELAYTAGDLRVLAAEVEGDPEVFAYDEVRRAALRADLDAAFFLLYGLDRDDIEHVMESFTIVKRDDIKSWGDFRTKLRILDAYDRMQRAIADSSSSTDGTELLDRDDGTDRRETISVLRRQIGEIERRPAARGVVQTFPFYDLAVAAGDLTDARNIVGSKTIRVRASERFRSGAGRFYFVARINGRSMEPTIRDGDLCLFRRPALTPRNGAIVLVERHLAEDAERGGRFAVKEYRRTGAGEGHRVQLISHNQDYPPIDATEDDKVLAEWVETVDLVSTDDELSSAD